MKIAINSEDCLRNKFVKAKCTACIDICPAKSINESLEVDKNCTNCGLCLANCPAEAVAGVSYSVEALQQIIAKDDPIRLICQKCQSDSPWACLGFLDPTLLLTFVYSGKDANREVLIYQTECGPCSQEVAQHIAWTVEEANRLLGSDKKRIVNSNKKFSALAPPAISRRQFFAELWGASVSTVREVAFPTSGRLHPIPRRELFHMHGGAKLIPRRIDNQSTFKTLTIDKACNACGICSKVCGAGALSTVTKDEVMEIRHNPIMCRDCGVCASQCPQGAISLLPAHSLNEEIVGTIGMPVCPDCGSVYQPIGNANVCIDCLQKNKIFSF